MGHFRKTEVLIDQKGITNQSVYTCNRALNMKGKSCQTNRRNKQIIYIVESCNIFSFVIDRIITQ